MALNGLFCADVLLRNYSLTHSLTSCISRQNSAGMLLDFSAFFSMIYHHLLALKMDLSASVNMFGGYMLSSCILKANTSGKKSLL